MTISERIFKILRDKNMSQNVFAQKAGLASSTVSDWKTKKTNPSADKIMDICEVLEVTPEQLLTGKGIDGEYSVETTQRGADKRIISRNDLHLLEAYQSLEEEQKKRLLKYVKVLKQIQDMEMLK